MKVAVIGGGAAGIGAAYRLIKADMEVCLFEADAKLGGHCFAVPVTASEGRVSYVDAGVSDFNQDNFVNVKALLDELELEYYPVVQDASFMRPDRTTLWYTREGQAHYSTPLENETRFQEEIIRFNTTCKEVLEDPTYRDWTTEHYLRERAYSEEFQRLYFYPRAAGCFPMPDKPPQKYMIRTLVAFYTIHGIVGGKPARRMVIKGGMFSYCEAFSHWFERQAGELFCNTRVVGIARREGGIRLRTEDNYRNNRTFYCDQVVIATNSNQVLPMFEDPSKLETRIFNDFQWQRAHLVVHRDERLMPSDSAAWRSYNYTVGNTDEIRIRPSITFYPNSLASLTEDVKGVFVSMNPFREPAPETVIYNKFFVHPAAGSINDMACDNLDHIQGARNTWFAGAYLREPFVHEQALSSGLDIAARLLDNIDEGSELARHRRVSFDDFLLEVPLFEGLEPAILSDVNLAARPFECNAGEVLFRQGQQAEGMYLIKEGRVRIEVRTPGDETLKVSTIDRRGIVGEMALMDSNVRSATVLAELDTHGYMISRQRFEMLRTDMRPAGLAVMNRLGREVAARCRLVVEEIGTKGSDIGMDGLGDTGPSHWDRKYRVNSLSMKTDSSLKLSQLQHLPIFDGFTPEEIESLLQEGENWLFPPGQLLFRRGDSPEGLVIVLRGALRSGLPEEMGSQHIFLHGPGTVAGVVSLIDGLPHPVDLSAREPASILFISRSRFEAMRHSGSAVSFNVCANVNSALVTLLRKLNNQASLYRLLGHFK